MPDRLIDYVIYTMLAVQILSVSVLIYNVKEIRKAYKLFTLTRK